MQQAPLAQRVAQAGGLNLDHVRTKVPQGLGSKGACNQLTQLNDFEANQWTSVGGKR